MWNIVYNTMIGRIAFSHVSNIKYSNLHCVFIRSNSCDTYNKVLHDYPDFRYFLHEFGPYLYFNEFIMQYFMDR